jgi:3-hydroxyacyl-[acyl-carrier-protein] dehydratase
VTESALAIAPDHPAFAGHFPGQPIVPGVLLLARVLQALAAEEGTASGRWSVVQAKFLRAVEPGTPLVLAREPTASGGVRFEIRSPAGVVASGTLAPR